MHIDQALSNSTTSYRSLNQLVQNSSVGLSDFGFRVISVAGYEGTASLAAVSQKWADLHNLIGDPPECAAAGAIQSKLKSYYHASDTMINESTNIFVIFSVVMRSCALFFARLFCIKTDDVYVFPAFRPSERKAVEEVALPLVCTYV